MSGGCDLHSVSPLVYFTPFHLFPSLAAAFPSTSLKPWPRGDYLPSFCEQEGQRRLGSQVKVPLEASPPSPTQVLQRMSLSERSLPLSSPSGLEIYSEILSDMEKQAVKQICSNLFLKNLTLYTIDYGEHQV